MKIRVNPILLGGFILGAIVLILLAIITIGSGNLFHATGHFVFYAPGSAQGLDKGTGVSLNGVRIGQVEQVRVLYDRGSRRSFVWVLCRINRNRVADAHGGMVHLTDNRVLKDLVGQGLRAQIETAGVVGAKFIELGFYDPSKYPPETGLPSSEYPVVPAIPSKMKELMDSASKFMEGLQKVDLAGISREVKSVLTRLDRQVGALETNRLTDHLSTAADSIGRLAASTNLQATVAEFRAAAAGLNSLATNLNTRVGPLAGQLGSTLAQGKAALVSVKQTANDLQDFVTLRNQLGTQTQGLLEQLTRTASTIDRLADFLEQHPNALISGRKQSPDTP
ncbi:MAG TPA: MlaD family protein [Verrucomicrobiae bacterium]|nr:MlaD family protein [Verrucomicrobiae bacterium]